MEENNQNQFKCTGNCLNCKPVQRQYCASQHAYNTMRMMQVMEESLKAMAGTVEELKTKITAIQDSEALVFDPNKKPDPPTVHVASATPTPTTQEGAGVKQ